MTFKQVDVAPCAMCGKGLAHDHNFMFWRLRIERLGLDLAAIQRHAGLEQALGSPALATIMGTDPDLAKSINGPHDVLVCEPCVIERMVGLFVIAERLADQEQPR